MNSDPLSVVVGGNIRRLRRAREMTQVELAIAIGTTFQQLQKYEKGITKIGATRLWLIAQALQAPIASFFPPEAYRSIVGSETENSDPNS